MTHIARNRVMELSTSTGTGAFVVAGSIAGHRTFASVASISDTFWGYIEAVDADGVPTGDWEDGLYTYSALNTITRTTVRDSSNGGAAVNFAAGNKIVAMGVFAPQDSTSRGEWRSLIGAAGSGSNSDITDLAGLTTAISGTNLGDKIQPITASASAGALTVTLNPTTLDFRSATLTSGTVTTLKVSGAISVVVPSGGTLGAPTTVAQRLAILAINNAGAVEAAVINVTGGVSLDESGTINTTAAGAGSTSASTAYSTSARTGVAYRVVGCVDAVNTAGAWGSPTLVQGAGGQALAALSGIGNGQTWQSVTGSRTAGVTYYNTTGKPIMVAIRGSFAGAALTVGAGGVETGRTNSTADGNLYAIVPPGQAYSMASGFTAWAELR